MNPKNRREFLKKVSGLGAAGVSAHLTRLGMVSANAQSTSTYKGMVCIFLFGGNDSNNTIVPVDSRYALYQSMRGGLAIAQGSLLTAGSSGYGFHPRMPNIQRLYNQGRAAMVLNVGMLVRPTTKANIRNTPLPRNLYSHDDQTQQWQTSDPTGGTSGWGGRLNERIVSQNTGVIPPGISLNGGNAMFLQAPTTAPANFANSTSLGLYGFGSGAAQTARREQLQRVLTFDSGVQMVGTANGVLESSIRTAQEFNAALSSAPPLAVAFPAGGLAGQLSQIIRLMSVRGSLGMNRQMFFAGTGGFDLHENQVGTHDNLLGNVDAALNAFFANIEAMGLMNNVTLFTESEFNRTANINTQNGTDHAWGGHHLVFGGAVRSGVYGTLPRHELRGPDDANDRGYWIPTTSLDQYGATLGSWYGVPDSELRVIFPNLANFTPQKLAFL